MTAITAFLLGEERPTQVALVEEDGTMETEEAAIHLLRTPHLPIHLKWGPTARLAVTIDVTEHLRKDSTPEDPLGTNIHTPPRLPRAGTSRKVMEPLRTARLPARSLIIITVVAGAMTIMTMAVIEENSEIVNQFPHDDTWTSMMNAPPAVTIGVATAYRVGTWGWLAP